MIERLRELVGWETGDGALYECRHCGRTLDHVPTQCPDCESDEIARYSL